jgi:hypothetical protein
VAAAESGEARAGRLRALSADRQAEADRYAAQADAIEKGNHGERVVAQLLDVVDGAGWYVLHDRYKPGSTANLDHVVVGPPGLFVIDAKNWKPAPLRFDERGMSLQGYRKDRELRGTAGCVELVLQRAIGAYADLPATGVLAFVQDMGLRVPVEHHGVCILQSADLLAWLTSRAPVLDRAAVQRVGATLDAALPPRAGKAKPIHRRRHHRTGADNALPSMRAPARAPPDALRSGRRRHDGPTRRRAPQLRAAFVQLAVRLLALLVVVLVIVPMALHGIQDKIGDVTRPPSSVAPPRRCCRSRHWRSREGAAGSAAARRSPWRWPDVLRGWPPDRETLRCLAHKLLTNSPTRRDTGRDCMAHCTGP